MDTVNDHEVAFVLAHEYGHLIGRHIEKSQQQALAGALIVGTLAAVAASNGDYYDPALVGAGIELGAAAGSHVYSQSYELESDALGTRITASAGYDPVKGALYFARPEDARAPDGTRSFWGTHPPDEKRLATVIASKKQMDADVSLQRTSPY